MYKLLPVLVFTLWLAGAIGWFLNLYKTATGLNIMDTSEAIIRCVGVAAAPLGAIIGYF